MPATTHETKHKKPAGGKKKSAASQAHRWSNRVTHSSNALDLENEVFKSTSARSVAESLKRSAEASKRRKASPFQSAMSMLNFYINRAGKNLPARRVKVLERAKNELRDLFGKARQPRRPATKDR